MINPQGYTGSGTSVYKGVQGLQEYAGYTRVIKVYRVCKSIQGVETLGMRLYKVYGVYKSIQGVL